MAAVDVDIDVIGLEKTLDVDKLMEFAAAELVVLVETVDELDGMLLELEDDEGPVEVPVVE
jgi:hypothetical protein